MSSVRRVVPIVSVDDIAAAAPAYRDVLRGARRFFFRDAAGTVVNVLSHPPGTLDG